MHSYSLFFFAVILLSCGNDRYESYHTFNDSGWNSDSVITFKYTINDTTSKHDFILNIRQTVDYEFQNLFLFLEGPKKDTIEIILANKSGKWLGDGISDVREFKHVFDKEIFFNKTGEYKLSVEQAMRYGSAHKIEKLEHILDIGLIVSKHND